MIVLEIIQSVAVIILFIVLIKQNKEIFDKNKEISSLQQELDKISKEIEDSNYKKLDLDFIESLLEKCADIRALDSNEQRLLIGVLVDKILWDGNTQNVTVYFIGSGDVKKK